MTVIASLITSLGLESSRFTGGLDEAQKALKKTQKQFTAISANLRRVGAIMSIGITAPFTALVAKAIPAAEESAQALGQVEAALKSMGPVAGRTTEQLQTAATALMHMSTFDDDEILRKVTANLLTFGSVAGEQFDRAQRAAVDLSTRMSGDLQASTLLVGKALNDPIKGMQALRRVGIQLTDQQKAQVTAFIASGQTAKAQGVILTELERQFGGSARAMRDATPGADLKNAWDDFQETIGGFALKVLPPLTAQLAKVLDAFNNLTPRTQQMAVAGAALLAAVGPVASAAGLAVKGFAALLPLLTTVAAEGAVAGAGLGALGVVGGPLLLVAAGATAVYLAFQHWPEIKGWIDGVVEETSKAGADIQGYLNGISAAADEADRRMGMQPRHDFTSAWVDEAIKAYNEVDAFFKQLGPWARQFDRDYTQPLVDSWNRAARQVNQFSDQVDAAIARAFSSAVTSAQRLYAGVKTWMQDKLGAVFTWVSDKAKAVGDSFYTLYDRVVGHSYVPDMVDEIGVQMRRLDAELVAPSHAATTKAAQAFQQLASEVRPLLDDLFPEEASVIDLEKKLALVDAWRKAGRMTTDQSDEARRRLFHGGQAAPDQAMPTADLPISFGDQAEDAAAAVTSAWTKTAAANDNLRGSFRTMVDDVANGLRGLANDIRGGDWLGALQSVLNIITDLGRSGVFGKSFAGRINSFEARASGGPVMAGRSYLVGERGPELLRMGGASGQIIPNHQIGSGVVRVLVQANDYFDARVDGRAGAASVQTVGANNRAMAMRGRQRLA